jgi:hypothetical protein
MPHTSDNHFGVNVSVFPGHLTHFRGGNLHFHRLIFSAHCDIDANNFDVAVMQMMADQWKQEKMSLFH